MMRTLILAASACALLAGAAHAQPREFRFGGSDSAAWCLFFDPYTYNCGFATLEQCVATREGVGGRCQPNPSGPPRSAAERQRHLKGAGPYR